MLLALRQRLSYANVMVTLLAFIVLGGGTYAAVGSGVPDREGVFRGCVNRATGGLRLVASARSCRRAVRRRGRLVKPGEFAIAWNQQGPPGLQGVQGPQGLQGLTGDRGAAAPTPSIQVRSSLTGTAGPGALGNGVNGGNGGTADCQGDGCLAKGGDGGPGGGDGTSGGSGGNGGIATSTCATGCTQQSGSGGSGGSATPAQDGQPGTGGAVGERADCLPGERVVGGGAWADDKAAVYRSHPATRSSNDPPATGTAATSWYVEAYNALPGGSAAHIRAYVLCSSP